MSSFGFAERGGRVLRGGGTGGRPARLPRGGDRHADFRGGANPGGIDRLALPRALLANPPERPADERSLAMAPHLLFRHMESITDKPLRTGPLVRMVLSGGEISAA